MVVAFLVALLAAVVVGAVFKRFDREYAGPAAFVSFCLVMLYYIGRIQ